MKSWNTHASYITGILAALLIGAIAVPWSHIQDLPGIISLALGLSSLLLAIIAIIQSLSGTSDITAGLAAIRKASEQISEASNRIGGVGNQVTDTSNQLNRIFERVSSSGNIETKPNEGVVSKTEQSGKFRVPAPFSFGGTVALYAVCLSVKTGKSFNMNDIYKEEGNLVSSSFGDGVVRTLIDFEIINGAAVDQRVKIFSIDNDVDAIMTQLKTRIFPPEAQKTFDAAIEAADRYFSNSIEPTTS